jgi:tRNA nucleotidyltransferase/poly(A) polymerase
MEFNKINLSIELIKQTIKDTEWENKIYIAGGAVRDEIIGENIKDIDLLVDFPDGGI